MTSERFDTGSSFLDSSQSDLNGYVLNPIGIGAGKATEVTSTSSDASCSKSFDAEGWRLHLPAFNG